ncbi:DUF4097 domain-containing protein [Bacillus sp. IITD106]|nr:DUF4097 domain-containing protein [Bacillus sp. IITD106]
MKKLYYLLFISLILFVSGCNSDGKGYELVDLDGIDTIYINNGSTNVHLTSTEDTKLETYYGNRDVEVNKNNNEIVLKVKQKWFHIGPKVNLNEKFQVSIPEDFSGKIFVNGSSGHITSEGLQTNNLEVKSKSGNVMINFANFHSDVEVNSLSGNVEMLLNTDKPDIDLKVKTASGNQVISVPLGVTSKQDENGMEGTAGKGTYKVHVKTASGNIAIK